MDIHLTKESVRAMAERLKSAVIGEPMSTSKSLEAVATVLGYRNWDTLSGLLKQSVPEDLRWLKKPVTLYVNAFSCDPDCSGPSWARVEVNQEFLRRICDLRETCLDEGLSLTSVRGGPDHWDDPDENDALNIRDDELRVGQRSWWFRGIPKHCDYSVESRTVSIDDMLAVLKDKAPNEAYGWVDVTTLVYSSYGDVRSFVEELHLANELTEDQFDKFMDA